LPCICNTLDKEYKADPDKGQAISQERVGGVSVTYRIVIEKHREVRLV